MKLASLLNLKQNEKYENMTQEIKVTLNDTTCYYTIERDNDGNIVDITGYHELIKQIGEAGEVTIANEDELKMDDVLSIANEDLFELDQRLFDAYVDDTIEFSSRLFTPDYRDEMITVYITLRECNATLAEN